MRSRKQRRLWRSTTLSIEQIGAQNEKSTALSGARQRGIDVRRHRKERQPRAGNNPAAILKATKRRAADQKTLATLDKRIENEKQLANAYGQWIGVVAAEQRLIVNGGLRGVVVILAIAHHRTLR